MSKDQRNGTPQQPKPKPNNGGQHGAGGNVPRITRPSWR